MAEAGGGYSVSKSQSLLARAREVEALIDARPALFFSASERIGGYPLFVARASGPHIWDIDGNRYIDLVLGWGSVVLGHGHPRVTGAVAAQAELRGANPTLLSVEQVELAERIVALCPNVDQVTFMKTGSDATDAAVRLARAITGRRYVLQWGLHGWHDWCAAGPAGVLAGAREFTLPLAYNDLDAAERLFAQYGDDVACAVLMPYEIEAPKPGFFEGLRALCQRHGALLVLDEIRSGFRMSLGGAQQYFGIEADLVTYGKALANGHAISVLGGRKAHMKHILSLGLTVTYYRAPDAIVAALATLDQLVLEDGPRRLEAIGRSLMAAFDRAATEAGVPARAVGLPWTPFIAFDYPSPARRERALRMFSHGMMARGVLLTPTHHWFVCTSMSEDDIAHVAGAARETLPKSAALSSTSGRLRPRCGHAEPAVLGEDDRLFQRRIRLGADRRERRTPAAAAECSARN